MSSRDRQSEQKPAIRLQVGREGIMIRALIILLAAWLVLAILLPLGELVSRSLHDARGNYVGFSNFIKYFSTPALSRSLYNSLFVSVVTTVVAVGLALVYAYSLQRAAIPGKGFFRYVALLPLFAPTMMYAIALIYLFGNKGLVTSGFFGVLGGAGIDIGLYGSTGIILSEIIYTFPQAFLILSVSLSVSDYRLYEAAESMGAGGWRVFRTVTLPGIRFGLVSALFVCFILSFTDFGAPKVVGGSFAVLATDIYQQVAGQQNLSMGATVSMVLLIPALAIFVLDRLIQGRHSTAVSSRARPFQVRSRRLRDSLLFLFCLGIAGAILILVGTVLFASLVKVWPYDLSLTLRHFTFQNVAGNGLDSFWNSIYVGALSALAGTVLTFFGAYLIERTKPLRLLRQFSYLLSILPLALPGLVIGIAYIFFFNRPEFSLPLVGTVPNPFAGVYGTVLILIIANVVHFFPVSFLTATTAVKKLDPEYEAVSQSMGVPLLRTFWAVTVPVSLPAVLEIFFYFFVNSMVTISAVIFLYSPTLKLASISIVHMEESGDTAAAAAMSFLILFTNLLLRSLYLALTRRMRRRNRAWLNNSGEAGGLAPD